MVKFNRDYTLYVEKREATGQEALGILNLASIGVDASAYVIVKLPFTIQFDIERNTSINNATAVIKVYNLNVKNRNFIRKNDQDAWDIRKVILQAGYNGQKYTVFVGTITRAYHTREGVNMITTIEAQDMGLAFSTSEATITISRGDSLPEAIKKVALNSLPGVTIGVISEKLQSPEGKMRGNSYVGDGPKILREMSGGAVFFDNGVMNALTTYECLAGEIKTLDSNQGLLSTPQIEQNVMTFDILFEPRLKTGQILELSSRTETAFNGFCKVMGFSHNVEISAAECGDAISTVKVFRSDFLETING